MVYLSVRFRCSGEAHNSCHRELIEQFKIGQLLGKFQRKDLAINIEIDNGVQALVGPVDQHVDAGLPLLDPMAVLDPMVGHSQNADLCNWADRPKMMPPESLGVG